VVKHYSAKAQVSDLCSWTGLVPSTYYYRPAKGKRGVKPSTHTFKTDGCSVSNEVVVEDIKLALQREFCCYGYHNITSDLRDMNYRINHKKVYRLMDENNLLLGKVIRTSGKRIFVKHRRIEATYPMECICLDIKYVYVHGEKRNYYLLTVLDVFTRKAISQILQSSIRKIDVINIFRKINLEYGIKGVTVRNDNGSQFIANDVKLFLASSQAKQEFTHIATPQENAYIEAFHSIVQTEVIDRCEFEGFYEAKTAFARHLKWYNNERKHGQLGRITPQQKWNMYQNAIFAASDKAETGNAGEQPVRNSLTNGNDMEQVLNQESAPSSHPSFLFQMPKKTQPQKEEIDLNSSNGFIQIIGG
jgi:putative transposase